MESTVIDTTAGQAAEEIARLDLPKSERVRIIVGGRDPVRIADEIGAEARARGLTEGTFREIMAELGYDVP